MGLDGEPVAHNLGISSTETPLQWNPLQIPINILGDSAPARSHAQFHFLIL